jgi:hypothetical protein
MNDTMTQVDARDDELGRRIGRALDRRAGASVAIDVGNVHRGARRRRARRHAWVGAASVALVVAAVAVVARRQADTSPADSPPASVPAVPSITGAAVLPASFGDPVFVDANTGGLPRGVALPRVDVWESGTTRVVVRTFEEPPAGDPVGTAGPSTTFEPPPTTAAAEAGTELEPGAIEQLALDQWVQFRSSKRAFGDNVIVRGVDRSAAEELFGALVEVDGAPAPPAGFDLVEHADASPAGAVAGWFTTVGYGAAGGDRWLTTTPVVPDRASIELAMSFSVGSVRSLDGRQVWEEQPVDGRDPGLLWIDPSGLIIGHWSVTGTDESIVGRVPIVSQSQFEQLAAGLSARLATKPVVASAEVDGLDVRLRGSLDDVVACIGIGAAEQCAQDVNASINQPPKAGAMEAIVDGQWVIFGFHELGVEGSDVPDLTDDRYVAPDGHALPIVTSQSDGFLWFVVRVPAGTASVTTSSSNDIGGVVGTIARPLLVGTLG